MSDTDPGPDPLDLDIADGDEVPPTEEEISQDPDFVDDDPNAEDLD